MSKPKNDLVEIQALASAKITLDDEYIDQALKCLEIERRYAKNEEKDLYIGIIEDLKRLIDKKPSVLINREVMYFILRNHFNIHIKADISQSISYAIKNHDMTRSIETFVLYDFDKGIAESYESINICKEKIKEIRLDMESVKSVNYAKPKIENARKHDKVINGLAAIQELEDIIFLNERYIELIEESRKQINDFIQTLTPTEKEKIKNHKEKNFDPITEYDEVRVIVSNHLNYWL